MDTNKHESLEAKSNAEFGGWRAEWTTTKTPRETIKSNPWRLGALAVKCIHENFQGVRRRVCGQGNGIGCFRKREAVGDEAAHVQPAGKDEAGDFGLEREVRGIAADEVFFV